MQAAEHTTPDGLKACRTFGRMTPADGAGRVWARWTELPGELCCGSFLPRHHRVTGYRLRPCRPRQPHINLLQAKRRSARSKVFTSVFDRATTDNMLMNNFVTGGKQNFFKVDLGGHRFCDLSLRLPPTSNFQVFRFKLSGLNFYLVHQEKLLWNNWGERNV